MDGCTQMTGHVFQERADGVSCCRRCGEDLDNGKHIWITRPLPGSEKVYLRHNAVLDETAAILQMHGYDRLAALLPLLKTS